jgi:unsaturated rhamnogalacturonyl hydrolase
MNLRLSSVLALLATLALAMPVFALDPAPKPVIGMDAYHNDDAATGKPTQFYWDITGAWGFSQLRDLLVAQGCEVTGVHTAITAEALAPLTIFIMDDPDKGAKAKLVQPAEVDALEAWVKGGGILLLMNDSGGWCEQTAFNTAARRFGITFNNDTAKTGTDYAPVGDSPLFAGVQKIHIVNQCTLTFADPATPVLTLDKQVLVATATVGKGLVFAVGDPWFYNEYLTTADNKLCATNLFTWLLAPRPAQEPVVVQ